MRRLSLLALLLVASAASAQEELVLPAGTVQGEGLLAPNSELSRFLWSDGSGSNSVVDACTSFSSELTAPSFCLRGDGTSTGSLTLSAVGSPTTQPWPWCENGLSCGSVSRQVVSASNYFQTASMAQPSGSWWACVRGIVDAPLPTNAWYVGQSGSWGLKSTSGQPQFIPTGGTNVSGSAATVIGGASQMVCVSYHFAGAGSVNTATLYLDGVQVGQSTTEPVLASVIASVTIGNLGGVNPISRLGFAMFGTGDPSATLFSRLASATAPTPQGTRGEAVSTTRASASWVSASDGSLTVLQNNRLGVSGGAAAGNARTNLATFSEQLENAAYSGSATATANTAVAPDGSTTADTLTSATTGLCRYQQINSTGLAANLSISGKAISGTPSFSVLIYDGTSLATLKEQVCTANTSSWTRCSGSVATTTGHAIQFRVCPATLSGSGSIYAWGFQPEWSSVASPYCRSEGTSSICAGDQVTVPTPSGLSMKEGSARVCIAPTFTGANPLASDLVLLSARATGGGRFAYVPASGQSVAISDGTHTATQTTTFTSGTARCFKMTWSAAAGTLTVTDLTSGSTTSASSFTGFSTFDSTLAIGSENGTKQPLGSALSGIQLGANAQAVSQ